jgi:hypothetical protein
MIPRMLALLIVAILIGAVVAYVVWKDEATPSWFSVGFGLAWGFLKGLLLFFSP